MNQWQRAFMTAGVAILAIAALYWTRSIAIPIVLSILLTFILGPMVAALERRGLRRVPAVSLVVFVICLALFAILTVVLLQTKQLALMLPEYKNVIAQKVIHVREAMPGSWLDEVTDAWKEIRETVNANKPADETPVGEPIPVTVTTSRWDLLLSATSVLDLLVSAGLVVILVIFMLIRREDLRNRLIRLFGDGNLTRMTKALDDAADAISRFMLIQFLINSGQGLILGLGLFLLGVPYSVLWGFLAAILRYLPYVGPWLSAIFPIATSAAVMPSWTTPLLVVGLIVILELVTSNVVEPILYGHSLGISEVALLLAAAFWAWLWGPMGLVLATPLTACLVVLGRFFPPLHGLTILLGDEPALDPGLAYYQRLLARDQDEAVALVEEQMKTRPTEEVLDQLLLAALIRTKQDAARGNLAELDAAFIYRVTDELLDDLEMTREFARASGSGEDSDGDPGFRASVIGWGPQGRAEEVGLRLLKLLLEPRGVCLAILARDMSVEDIIAQIEHESPAAICIASIPPAAVSPVRHLCTRLRARCEEAKIVLGRWGQQEDRDKVAKLTAAGVDRVGANLIETRDQMLELLPNEAVPAHSE